METTFCVDGGCVDGGCVLNGTNRAITRTSKSNSFLKGTNWDFIYGQKLECVIWESVSCYVCYFGVIDRFRERCSY